MGAETWARCLIQETHSGGHRLILLLTSLFLAWLYAPRFYPKSSSCPSPIAHRHMFGRDWPEHSACLGSRDVSPANTLQEIILSPSISRTDALPVKQTHEQPWSVN